MDKNFEIKEKIGVIKEDASGDTLELNIVAWYGSYAKFDIRRWSPVIETTENIEADYSSR